MNNVDRMYRHLVRTIRTRFPQYLTQPFDVTELHQTILPYRHHRRELGLETNDDYELTLTELLSGAGDYLIVDDRMREGLRAELAAVNPDPGAFKKFAGSTVALSPNALRSLEAGPDDPSTPLATAAISASAKSTAKPAVTPAAASTAVPPQTQTPARSAAAAAPPPASTPSTAPSGARAIVPQPGERCRSCDQVLPPGRPITFCPHCGQDVTTTHCPACGSELELGWKFCPVCGRPANAH
jgi:Double zinc ribbon